MKGLIGKLIPAVVGLIVGAGGLIGLTIAMGGSFPPGAKAEAAATPAPQVEPHGVLYPTRERIVNLSDNGILRYLKTTIVLEISDPEAAKGGVGSDDHAKKGPPELPKDLKNKAAMIEDKITAVLTAKTATELMTRLAVPVLRTRTLPMLCTTLGTVGLSLSILLKTIRSA